nr:helix-turn-helix domain-containing protein [Novosphingobium lentum]
MSVRSRNGQRGPDVEPITVRVDDAARITGLCRSKIFRLIASGDIETVKIGKARIVFVDSLNAFLRARAAAQNSRRLPGDR